MAEEQLIQGNRAKFVLQLLEDGVPVTDLNTDDLANSKFQLSSTVDGTVELSYAGDAPEVSIDTPVTGSITVIAPSADMGFAPKTYFRDYERRLAGGVEKIEYQDPKPFRLKAQRIT